MSGYPTAGDGAEGEPDGADGPVRHHVSNAYTGDAGQVFQAGGNIFYNDYRSPAPQKRKGPYQVRPGTPRFINRTGQLAMLHRWLAGDGDGDGTPRTCVISGVPGIGTRSTARRWAEDMRDAYPGGVLYVDFAELSGPSGGGDVRGAQAQVLRSAFGVAEKYLEVPGPELDALYRSKTDEGGRILLVLENVTQPAQVSALVPVAPGSAVVATSHRRLEELALDGAHLMPLSPLGTEHGRQLLARLCGTERVEAEPEAAARLVECCGGLPLALTIAGSRLAARRGLGLAALAAELQVENERLAALSVGSGPGRRSVSAALAVACRDLPRATLRLYRRLGLLPGRTFHAETAAVVDGRDERTVRGLIDDLHSASLLEEQIMDGEPTGRHAFHDLVRLHARTLAEADETDAERASALRRLVDHYVLRAAFADRAVMGNRLRITDHGPLLVGQEDPFAGPGARDAALDWLEAERHNAVAVVRTAVERGLDRQAAQLAESLTALYLNHRHLTDWVDTGTLGAAAAARRGDPAMEARLRSLLSRPLMDMGLTDRARQESDRALALADTTGHLVLRASVREFSARYWDGVDPARALALYEEALDLNTQAGEWRGVALVRYFMGCTQDAAGEHGLALATLTDAYDRLVGLGDARMAGRALAALGAAHDALGRPAEAVRALRRAAEMLEEQRASFYEARVREALADLAVRGGEHGVARRELGRAVELLGRDGSPRLGELRERLAALGGDG